MKIDTERYAVVWSGSMHRLGLTFDLSSWRSRADLTEELLKADAPEDLTAGLRGIDSPKPCNAAPRIVEKIQPAAVRPGLLRYVRGDCDGTPPAPPLDGNAKAVCVAAVRYEVTGDA